LTKANKSVDAWIIETVRDGIVALKGKGEAVKPATVKPDTPGTIDILDKKEEVSKDGKVGV